MHKLTYTTVIVCANIQNKILIDYVIVDKQA